MNTLRTHPATRGSISTFRQRVRAHREERALLRLIGNSGHGTLRDELIDMNESVRS